MVDDAFKSFKVQMDWGSTRVKSCSTEDDNDATPSKQTKHFPHLTKSKKNWQGALMDLYLSNNTCSRIYSRRSRPPLSSIVRASLSSLCRCDGPQQRGEQLLDETPVLFLSEDQVTPLPHVCFEPINVSPPNPHIGMVTTTHLKMVSSSLVLVVTRPFLSLSSQWNTFVIKSYLINLQAK